MMRGREKKREKKGKGRWAARASTAL